MQYFHYQRCAICTWRRQLIQQDDDATDAPEWACDSEHPVILKMLHEMPSPDWCAIIATSRLCSPDLPVRREGQLWLRIPLRCDTHVECSDCCYVYDGCLKEPQDTVVGIHNTRLESLVKSTYAWTGTPNGNGILVDGRLRYGCCTHRTCSGSIAAEVSKHLQAPQGGFRSKCVAQTRQSSRVADKAGIVFAVQVEKCATKPLLLLYGLSTKKFRKWCCWHEYVET